MSREFELDRFQLEAIAALDRGHSVLVSAPTGAGKTVVAEHAVERARDEGTKVFYTTPIKALSNQKFRDLRERYGDGDVGLLTGDNSINGAAPIVVMTTEVLRNMIYSTSPALADLGFVILDEVHYLQDAYRGPVWEEVIIHAAPDVSFVCLSATVSNASELASWIESVRGPTELVLEMTRPVELRNLYMVGDRSADRNHLVPTIVDGRPNREASRFDVGAADRSRRGGRRWRQRWYTPSRVEVVERLGEEDLRPAIYFIFSRAGCDAAVRACIDAGLRLTDRAERAELRELAQRNLVGLAPRDLDALGHERWIAGLERGVAAHHAGLVPAFKETVEEAFSRGLLKVVFATETLALGINMPARSVVIENLSKWGGEQHELLTPGEYTQLTGRAGRRGIDENGHAIVLWSPFVAFAQVAALAASRSFSLRSAFAPTYNMTANLVRRYSHEAALRLLLLSFAQFQVDREIVVQQRRIEDRRRVLDETRSRTAGNGDLAAYDELRRQADRVQDRHRTAAVDTEEAISRLRPGDLVVLGDQRAVIVSIAYRHRGAGRVRLLLASGDLIIRTGDEFDQPPVARGSIELPEPYAPNNRQFLRATGEELRRARLRPAQGPTPAPLNPVDQAVLDAVDEHPCAADPRIEDRLTAFRAIQRLEAQVADAERRVARRSDSIADRFERVLSLLVQRGYVEGWSLTDRGQRLASLYHECDLVIADCLDTGVFDGLEPEELAAVASVFTYEHRSSTPPPPPEFPNHRCQTRFEEIEHRVRLINQDERHFGVPLSRPPDPGFMVAATGWAAGKPFDRVVEPEIAPGDFVRSIKTLVDLLRQIARTAPEPSTTVTATATIDALLRGVVVSATAAVVGVG